MKKILTILALILCISCFAACSNDTTTETISSEEDSSIDTSSDSSAVSDTSNDTKSDNDIPKFFSLEISKELEYDSSEDHPILQLYRSEVLKRLEKGEGNFYSEEEMEYLQTHLHKVNEKYWERYDEKICAIYTIFQPMVIKTYCGIEMLYFDEYGYLDSYAIEGETMESWYGNVHTPKGVYEEYEDSSYSITLENGIVTYWQFGQAIATYQMAEDTVFCGYSDWEGHIFRSGSEVFAITDWAINGDSSLHRIATGVKMVILADYRLNSDAWAQPLFLMEDGTVKAYLEWADRDSALDSPTRLVDVQYEGGYPHR